MAKGPLGNAPRDLRDDFVGTPSELYKGGEPAKKTRNPKKVTSNTFHTTVTGETSNKRPDRAGHFRSGGFVRGKADGGAVRTLEDVVKSGDMSRDNLKPVPMPNIGPSKGRMAPMPRIEGNEESKRFGPGLKKGGSVGVPSDRSMPSTATEKYKKGGKT